MTRDELRDHIARTQLGILGRGSALSAEDARLIETVMDNVQGELEQAGIALWTLDDMPAYAVESFGLYVKASMSGFGFEPDYPMQDFAQKKLRYLTVDKLTGAGKADYF